MPNVYDTLKSRGYLAQCTHEDELRDLLGKESVTFYMGYDPTANSLTTGHLMTLMIHKHMQDAGHQFITVMGTGTGMIGDPTERSDMRRVMTRDEVLSNIEAMKAQFSRFVTYGDGGAIMEENNWLLDLKLVEFMRDYGVHFNVNRMLAAECYKSRLKDGLTAFEMTYMLMQAYDFLHLFRKYNCRLQLGGSDQWGNIIAGVDLIRKIEGKGAYGLTNVLLTAADGGKMGKSMGNAVWLDATKTSPYDFYQHWRNTADTLVVRDLKLFTFLPLEQIEEMAKWEGAQLNKAKEILAFEVTKIVHGEEEAQKAQDAAKSLFTKGSAANVEAMPSTALPASDFLPGMNIIEMLEKTKMIQTRSEGRRLIQSGGVKINDKKIESHEHVVSTADFTDEALIIQKGKKFHRVQLS